MTARELLAYQIDHVGNQLRKTFEGLDGDHRDHRILPQAMTPREILAHLCEVYHACIEEAEGRRYEWGSWKTEDNSWENVKKEFFRMRELAMGAVVRAGDGFARKGYSFIVDHDAYHVGQMSLIRMSVDPAWDPYSLYSE
jgi:uncharacterized damage-inducible protein DinB